MIYEDIKQMLRERDKIPYPELRGINKNPIYAKYLYDSFAGEMGELSAITQYIFEHIDKKLGQEVNKIMLLVAVDEMKHFNKIGNLIQELGLPPHYVSAKLNPWNSNFVRYDTGNLRETMEYNIFTEKEAIKEYKRGIANTRNISIQKLLNRIILDEKSHIEIFTRIIEESSKI